MNKKNREPAVAGKFYPADIKELKSELDSFFYGLKPQSKENPLAIIVPHAGYVFSAGVAAKAFSQIDRNAKFERIFIIGSSHTMAFDGASVYTLGDFITPLGNVEVDSVAENLTKKFEFINNNTQPHVREHCIEVQLPLLQYWLKNPFKIVPIIIGGSETSTSKQLADALKPYFNENNLFIISSDFSHYPNYVDAVDCDKSMADAIISNSPEKFMATKYELESKSIDNLATAACGWTSILTLLYITENLKDIKYIKSEYKNSGDSPYGGKDKVVGYNSICVFQNNNQSYSLTDSDKKQLLDLAHNTIQNYVSNNKIDKLDEKIFSSNLSVKAGAFVSLYLKGELKGCIGTFSHDDPLFEVIQNMAISAATKDYRFEPVKKDEVDQLEIEISVLTPTRKIKSVDEFELGKHGIFIKKDGHSGTFLPQVAEKTKWTKEEFLGHCARDKAFIGWDGWRDAELYVYETIVFKENK